MSEKSYPFKPDWPPTSPGESIGDWLLDTGLHPSELAARMGTTHEEVDDILHARIPITRDIAERLERAIGSTADFWLKLEAGYRAGLDKLSPLQALARRAVACLRWRWMPGMLTEEGHRVVLAIPTTVVAAALSCDRFTTIRPLTLPDLRDPATVGCLLVLVREAWEDPDACAVYHEGEDSTYWAIESLLHSRKRQERSHHTLWFASMLGSGATEVEALVEALEDAP